LKRTTQLLANTKQQQRKQSTQAISLLQKLLAAVDEQIESNREDYPVATVATCLISLFRLLSIKKAELNKNELSAYTKKMAS
jgi:hypothetical protein